MAIVNCPECNREVSDTAVSCPGCGFRVAHHFTNSNEPVEAAVPVTDTHEATMEKSAKRGYGLKVLFAVAAIIAIGFLLYSYSESSLSFEDERAVLAVQKLYGRLKDPKSLDVHNIEYMKWPDDDYHFMCKLNYSARNSYGGVGRESRYIAIFGGTAFIISDEELSKVESIWKSRESDVIQIDAKKVMKNIEKLD